MRAAIRSLLAAALTGMTGMIAGSAMAADGTINFTGEITSGSCVVTSVGGGSGLLPGNNIIVPLGMVSLSSLGNTPGANLVGSRSVDINLDCTGKLHHLRFQARDNIGHVQLRPTFRPLQLDAARSRNERTLAGR